ncbi:MAG: GNAT family N-acetyltransferase [Chlorobiales bacterium]|nr:GNAT family N-acetyltransferase [Chlorobiales bacterium]
MNVKYDIVTSIEELQQSFFVRSVVFIEEQNVLYVQEFDENEYNSTHFIATIDKEPVAAARLRVLSGCAKIERLSVRKAYRGKSIGKCMFDFVLKYAMDLKCNKVVVHAQSYLLQFYEGFGFYRHGDKFLEAGIEHYYMEKENSIK